LSYLSSSIWALLAQTLVDTVNAVGLPHLSKLEYVEAGLNKFAERYEQTGITNLRCSVKQS